MSMVDSDFEYEKGFAANAAATRYATWEEYAREKMLAQRFPRPEELDEIRRVFDTWKERDGAIGAAVTACDSN